MRAFEVRSFSPLRCANVLAVVAAAFYGALAVLLFPVFLGMYTVMPKLAASSGAGHHPSPPSFPAWLPLVFLVCYPVIGGVLGWITGGLGALIYNFVVRYTGGIEMQLEEAVPSPSV